MAMWPCTDILVNSNEILKNKQTTTVCIINSHFWCLWNETKFPSFIPAQDYGENKRNHYLKETSVPLAHCSFMFLFFCLCVFVFVLFVGLVWLQKNFQVLEGVCFILTRWWSSTHFYSSLHYRSKLKQSGKRKKQGDYNLVKRRPNYHSL